MAFPSNPSSGETYTDPATDIRYIYYKEYGQWYIFPPSGAEGVTGPSTTPNGTVSLTINGKTFHVLTSAAA